MSAFFDNSFFDVFHGVETGEYAFRLGSAVCTFFNGRENVKILLSSDGSSHSLFSMEKICDGIATCGVKPYVLTQCGVGKFQWFFNKTSMDFGVYVSCGEHTPEICGFTLFQKGGVERRNVLRLEDILTYASLPSQRKGGCAFFKVSCRDYSKKFANLRVQPYSVVVDTACGATTEYAKDVFLSSGFKTVTVRSKRDERFVNCASGACYPKRIANFSHGFDFGVAVDGVGRGFAVAQDGAVIPHEKVLLTVALYMKSHGVLLSDTLCTSECVSDEFLSAARENGLKVLTAREVSDLTAWQKRKRNVVLCGDGLGKIWIDGVADGLFSAALFVKATTEIQVDLTPAETEVVTFSLTDEASLKAIPTWCETVESIAETQSGCKVRLGKTPLKNSLRLTVTGQPDRRKIAISTVFYKIKNLFKA